MMKRMTKCLLLGLFLCVLAGCGKKNDELTTYKTNMETFCANVEAIGQRIDAIDTTSESSTTEFLGLMDQLSEQFSKMAALPVPDRFSAASDLAIEASENMSNAVTYYHQAYEGETFSQNYAEAANEYYSRANERLQYVLQILHGEDVTQMDLSFADEIIDPAAALEEDGFYEEETSTETITE